MTATENQKRVFKIVATAVRKGKKVSITKAMRESGVYSKHTSKQPAKITKSKGWQELLNEYLPDLLLSQRHKELLDSTHFEHMTFPPFNEGKELSVQIDDGEEVNVGEKFGEQLTDQEIRDLLASTNCTVRKIVHGEQARHVYFWSADNKARDGALDMAYKLKGKYAPEKHVSLVAHISDEKKTKINRILGIT